MNVLWQTLRIRSPPSIPLSRTLASFARHVPNPTNTIETPTSFLKSIGRSADTKLKNAEEMRWYDFWQTDGVALKKAGVGVRDRRYILWCMEKFRNGESVDEFAHEPTPKKKIRGWGPTVQNGKRIRSRRDRTKPSEPKQKKTEEEKQAKRDRKRAFRSNRDSVLY